MKHSRNVLRITHLKVAIDGKEILHGIDLLVRSGEVHAIMGPNGSGKSTFSAALLGHPSYTVKGSVLLNHKNLLPERTEARAKAGLFLAFQSPIAIPGVSVMSLLRASYQELHANKSKTPSIQNPVLARRFTVGAMAIADFTGMVKGYAKKLNLDESFLQRGIHDGFSGGEKKKVEMLQALVLRPKFAVFDEIDTGLDVDALKVVASGIRLLQEEDVGVIVITHYQRILKYILPDVVHVLVAGRIVKSGKAKLAAEIEEKGYSSYITKTKTPVSS